MDKILLFNNSVKEEGPQLVTDGLVAHFDAKDAFTQNGNMWFSKIGSFYFTKKNDTTSSDIIKDGDYVLVKGLNGSNKNNNLEGSSHFKNLSGEKGTVLLSHINIINQKYQDLYITSSQTGTSTGVGILKNTSNDAYTAYVNNKAILYVTPASDRVNVTEINKFLLQGLSWDKKNYDSYVNGELQNSQKKTGSLAGENVPVIGRAGIAGAVRSANIKVGSIYIYNRKLSDEEVMQVYQYELSLGRK